MPGCPNPLIETPAAFGGTRTSGGLGLTLMGWNQLVFVDADAANLSALGISDSNILVGGFRTTDYAIGVNQTGEAPDYICGRSDRAAWTKGPIETEGDLTFPFTYSKGLGMFVAGANLVFSPSAQFEISSSAHPIISGCKVNSVEISVSARETIEMSANIWGIVDEGDLNKFRGDAGLVSGDDISAPGAVSPDLTAISSADGDQAQRILGVNFGVLAGVEVHPSVGPSPDARQTINIEQIPQWDVCEVRGAPPSMHVIGISVRIDNNLLRNYTMGDNSGASPFGLNATSITANQRTISGTVTWQSDMSGNITQIMGTGIECLEFIINGPDGPISMVMGNCLWNATPPRLSATDRVTVEASFTALGENRTAPVEFDALVLTGPGITTPS